MSNFICNFAFKEDISNWLQKYKKKFTPQNTIQTTFKFQISNFKSH